MLVHSTSGFNHLVETTKSDAPVNVKELNTQRTIAAGIKKQKPVTKLNAEDETLVHLSQSPSKGSALAKGVKGVGSIIKGAESGAEASSPPTSGSQGSQGNLAPPTSTNKAQASQSATVQLKSFSDFLTHN